MEDHWANFLNPEIIRKRFVTAGLFMVVHEMLLSAIRDRLHDFYSDEWSSDNGWETTQIYKQKVLALDPKGKNDVLRGSLAWLCNCGAITESDALSVKRFTDIRNKFAHELRDIVGIGNAPDFDNFFPELVELVTKIDRWWTINVEIATDPEMADSDFSDDEVTPGSAIVMQILTRVALGDDTEAWELYHEFMGELKRSPT